jgi:succinate-semialdehyde dehydrogenase/glutarate-semialdehyde dehydrogenase
MTTVGLHSVVEASVDDVRAAVDRAAAAFPVWRGTSPGDRAGMLRAAAASVREAADELGELLCGTTGRLLGEATGSAAVAADLLDEAAVSGLAGGRSLAGQPGAVDWVRAEPRGVVAVVTPWNDPYPAAAGLLAAALITGNTVVHKPSERSLEPGLQLAALIARALPDGVLEVVAGGPETGGRLVADPRVAVVAHVGSSATGQAIRTVCGARGSKAITENGGKDPIVVDDNVDPRWAAGQIATGAFTNAGQLCTAVERVYLHRAVADEVLTELTRLADGLVVGDPADPATTLGPLVDEAQLAVVAEHVEDAVRRGARLRAGGRRLGDHGHTYAATVLEGCTPDMLVMSEETFGPVAPVTVVDSWEEGLRQAGLGRFGLAATVLTNDPAHALQAVEELEVGTVKVNAVFGGAPGGSADPRRDSGQGRGYGPDLLGELVALKAVHWEPAPANPLV